jgi:hypothetical protein
MKFLGVQNLQGDGGQIRASAGTPRNKDETKNREADGYKFTAEASNIGGTIRFTIIEIT